MAMISDTIDTRDGCPMTSVTLHIAPHIPVTPHHLSEDVSRDGLKNIGSPGHAILSFVFTQLSMVKDVPMYDG